MSSYTYVDVYVFDIWICELRLCVCICVSIWFVCLHGMYDMYGMYVLKYVCVYDMYMNTYYILSIWLYDTTNIKKNGNNILLCTKRVIP